VIIITLRDRYKKFYSRQGHYFEINHNNSYKSYNGLNVMEWQNPAEEKPLEGRCESYLRDEDRELVQCPNPGRRKYDNGLDSGIHCDPCWHDLVADARKRSW
jgi:hypothetical protein